MRHFIIIAAILGAATPVLAQLPPGDCWGHKDDPRFNVGTCLCYARQGNPAVACNDGQSCDPQNGCRARAGLNAEECSTYVTMQSDPSCQAGLECRPFSPQVSRGQCQAVGAPGPQNNPEQNCATAPGLCTAAQYCNAGECIARLGAGQVCAANNQCVSGLCDGTHRCAAASFVSPHHPNQPIGDVVRCSTENDICSDTSCSEFDSDNCKNYRDDAENKCNWDPVIDSCRSRTNDAKWCNGSDHGKLGHNDRGTCEPVVQAGNDCSQGANRQCANGLVCNVWNRLCEGPKPPCLVPCPASCAPSGGRCVKSEAKTHPVDCTTGTGRDPACPVPGCFLDGDHNCKVYDFSGTHLEDCKTLLSGFTHTQVPVCGPGCYLDTDRNCKHDVPDEKDCGPVLCK